MAAGDSRRTGVSCWRKPLRDIGEDPFGDVPSSKLAKQKLDELLAKGEPESAGVIHGAIESFAQEFAGVVGRFLKLKQWKDAERVVVGGGFIGSRVGEIRTFTVASIFTIGTGLGNAEDASAAAHNSH